MKNMTRLKEIKKQNPKPRGGSSGESSGPGTKFDAGAVLQGLGENKNKIMKIATVAAVAAIALAIIASYFAVEGINKNIENSGPITITYFYSNACSGCAAQKPILESVVAEFSGAVEVEKKCVTLIGESSDQCVLEQGLEAYEKNMAEMRGLGAEGVPIVIIGNGESKQQFVGKREAAFLKGAVCSELYGFWHTLNFFGNEIRGCK